MTRQINLALATFVPRKPVPGFGLFDASIYNTRVRPGDLDIYMHVNNAVYLNMMDSGRSHMLADMDGLKKLGKLGWYPVVAASSVKYRSSLLLGQKVRLETRVIAWDQRICYLSQIIKHGDKVVTEAWIAARFLTRKHGPNPSPQQVMDVLGYNEESPEIPQDLRAWADATGVLFREKSVQPKTD